MRSLTPVPAWAVRVSLMRTPGPISEAPAGSIPTGPKSTNPLEKVPLESGTASPKGERPLPVAWARRKLLALKAVTKTRDGV